MPSEGGREGNKAGSKEKEEEGANKRKKVGGRGRQRDEGESPRSLIIAKGGREEERIKSEAI